MVLGGANGSMELTHEHLRQFLFFDRIVANHWQLVAFLDWG
jgi:hypothetical protein